MTAKPVLPRLTTARPRVASPAPAVAPENVASTVVEALSSTLHVVVVPPHEPLQRRNLAPVAGTALSSMLLPASYDCLHVRAGPLLAQAPPLADTVPFPLTIRVSVAVLPVGGVVPLNAAETFFAAFIVTVQVVALPLQAPPQLVNVAPEAGVAVSVADVFAATLTLQIEAPLPQLTPEPVTVPLPVTLTESGNVEPAPPPVPVKTAVTLFAASIVTVQVSVAPAHAPPQPVNPAPEPGVAVSVTAELDGSLAVQPAPPAEVQAIPPPVTVPSPVTETVSAKVVADGVNDAFTLLSASMDTVQLVAVPAQAPPQPVNAYPDSGVARTVTVEPVVGSHVQLLSDGSQSMLPPFTLPPLSAESPVTSTESVLVPGGGVVEKVAVA